MSEFYQKKKTYVALVLDKSGSMETCRDEIISGYNEYIQGIQKNAEAGGETLVSLFTFDSHVQKEFFNEKADGLKSLDREIYKPGGCTAMYDGVGACLDELSKFDEEGNVGFWIIVLSDGAENASKLYNSEGLAKQISKLQSTGRWSFSYVGADHDLAVAKKMGFETLVYENNVKGRVKMWDTINAGSKTYFSNRSMGVTNCNNILSGNN